MSAELMRPEDLLSPQQDGAVGPRLEFLDGQVRLAMRTMGGLNIERYLSWAAVREAATGIPIDSGWLAPEVIRWGTGRGGDWAVAWIPPGQHRLEITNGTPGQDESVERLLVPLPGLVLFGTKTTYFVWAQKTEQASPHHEVFRAPLPNVYLGLDREHHAGEICWGDLKPPICTGRTIADAFRLFIGSTFNAHATSEKSKRHREDVRIMLRTAAAAGGAYPVEDLVRVVDRTGATLDQMMRGILEGGAEE